MKRPVIAKGNIHLTNDGFTLIELIVVLAGLGILSSLTIPNVVKILDFNNIDEAKAILNSAAADCLQKTRLSVVNDRDIIDSGIVSDKRLKTIGYAIDPDANNCSYFQLNPSNSNDNLRYPIGFSVSDGRLSKFANPTSSDATSINSCESWAGINCKQDESLKQLIAHKKTIAIAEQACGEDYTTWLRNGTNPNKFKRWNTNASSGCPSRPPSDGSSAYKTSDTCTPEGCNKTVYGLDGTFVGFEKANYDAALEEKYGKICTEKAKAKRDNSYTNPSSTSITINECGAQKFWFFDGVDVGSQPAWEKLFYKANKSDGEKTLSDGSKLYLCLGEDKGAKDLMDNCISAIEKAACDNRITERIDSKKNGYFKAQDSGPMPCTNEYWFCDGSDKKTEAGYKDSKCGPKKPKVPTVPKAPKCAVNSQALCKMLGGKHCECRR